MHLPLSELPFAKRDPTKGFTCLKPWGLLSTFEQVVHQKCHSHRLQPAQLHLLAQWPVFSFLNCCSPAMLFLEYIPWILCYLIFVCFYFKVILCAVSLCTRVALLKSRVFIRQHVIRLLPRFVKMKVAQLCLTLCDPMDYTAHGILQARILEWVAVFFSRGSSQPRDWTQVSHIVGGFFTSWAQIILSHLLCILRFTGGSDGKESACNAGDLGLIPGLGRSPGGRHRNPLQYSCLENPHGQRSLAGYSPWGGKELDMTEQLSFVYYFQLF